MYPFGYGLGYSEILYSGLTTGRSVDEAYVDGDIINITVAAINQGKFDQFDVPQVYVHRVDSKIEAFDKVEVKAGASVMVHLEVPVESLKYWDEEKHDWVLEPGKIELLLAHNAGNVVLKTECTIK